MEKKVTQQVLGYLSDYASAKGTNTEQLSIVIARPAQKIVVEAYREHQFIETIPLKQLITYFSNHPSNAWEERWSRKKKIKKLEVRRPKTEVGRKSIENRREKS